MSCAKLLGLRLKSRFLCFNCYSVSQMKKIFIVLLLFMAACQNQNSSVDFVDVGGIPFIKLDSVSKVAMKEIVYPQGLYVFKDDLVGVCINQGAEHPFYLFDKDDFSFKGAFGAFGRGAGEFFDVNPYYFEKTDTSVFINTNHYFETEIVFKNDSVEIADSRALPRLTLNNLTKLNDSLFVCNNDRQEEYSLFDINKHKVVKSFGDFPITALAFEENDDRNNFMERALVCNPKEQKLMSFYRYLPLIRLYDFDGNLLKEIKLKGLEQKDGSVDDFYDGAFTSFFVAPAVADDLIYVLFMNKNEEEFMKEPSIGLQVWDWSGKLLKRYRLDEPFHLYTVSDQVLYGLNSGEEDNHFFKVAL